jgi:hypothetical protein
MTPQKPTDYQTPPPQFKLNISKEGGVSYEGDMNEETQQIIQQALDQAHYYKQKAADLEESKVKKTTETDAISIMFMSAVLMMIMFVTMVTISSVTSLFKPTTQSTIHTPYKA